MNGLSCLSLSLACVNKIAYNLYENFALASIKDDEVNLKLFSEILNY
jgi:hypothetical protein